MATEIEIIGFVNLFSTKHVWKKKQNKKKNRCMILINSACFVKHFHKEPTESVWGDI